MIKHDKIVKAVLKINPNAKFILKGETIKWLENTSPISNSNIEAQFTAVEFDNAMQELRDKRNKLITETDHLALSDQTLSTEMTTYRQALRDITNNLTTVAEVNAVTFPTKPSED